MPEFKVGAETWGVLEDGEVAAWAGPAVSWAPSPKLWAAATAGVGLNDGSDRLNIRFILGLGL